MPEQKTTDAAPVSLMYVAISLIRPGTVSLRPAQTASDEYVQLRMNIKQHGMLQPLRVRERTDEATNEKYYELIDGLQRFTIATELGFEEVPVVLSTASDIQVLVQQMALNAVRVQTQPAQFAQQLARIMLMKPTTTKAELSTMVGMSPAWIDQRLSLVKLIPEIQDLVDQGIITVSNGYQLARLPAPEQPNYVEAAQTTGAAEFINVIAGRLKEIRKERLAGRQPGEKTEFEPRPLLRKSSEIQGADPLSIIQAVGASNASDGAKAALAWVLQLDPESVLQQKAKHEARQKELSEKKAKDRAENALKHAEKAKQHAEELRRALGTV